MTVVVALLVGFVTVRFLRVASSDILRAPALQRENFRGVTLPTAGGIFIVLALLIVEGRRAVLGALGVGSETGLTLARSEVLFAVFGFGFLGLVDDLAAVGKRPRVPRASRRAARTAASRPACSSWSAACASRSCSSPPPGSSPGARCSSTPC